MTYTLISSGHKIYHGSGSSRGSDNGKNVVNYNVNQRPFLIFITLVSDRFFWILFFKA